MLYVSYAYYSKAQKGFGRMNISSDGFYSIDDVNKAVEIIKLTLKKDFNMNDDVDLIILNWRKYDLAP